MLGFSGGGKPKESDEEKEYRRLAVFVENYDPAGEQMVDELKDAGEEETDECIPPLAIVNGECIGDPEADPMPPAVKRECDADQRSFTCAQYKLRVRERRVHYHRALEATGYTPYEWEAAAHLRNAAVANKYRHLAREARGLGDLELANKLLKEFKAWTRLPRAGKSAAYRNFHDSTVGPIGHHFHQVLWYCVCNTCDHEMREPYTSLSVAKKKL